jgi:hypothetical protein
LAVFLIVPIALSACGGSGSYWYSPPTKFPELDSKLSVFGLNGTDPRQYHYSGGGAQAHQQADRTTLRTDWVNTTINAGAFNSKNDIDRDEIYSSELDIISTNAARRLDNEGGETDSFNATLNFFHQSQSYQTDQAQLTIRNMDGSGGTDLDYSTYGYWSADFPAELANPAFTRTTAIAFGETTPLTNIPSTGGAVYAGTMGGLYSEGPGTVVSAAGSVELSVNFETRTAEGLVHDIAAGGENLRDIAFQPSSMSGGSFLGSAVTLAAAPGQTGPEMNGSYYGSLYGPAAEEAAGAFAVTGGGNSLVGGFAGAARP